MKFLSSRQQYSSIEEIKSGFAKHSDVCHLFKLCIDCIEFDRKHFLFRLQKRVAEALYHLTQSQ